ncbi:hypothetical protein O4J56_13215 [Nocardiopsis sp. RSe5-2]|uniref:Uncharacterized protein n=1 Tax=Nocardiopsis endophytica TaxID=3018445 RepID=A0ABT4U575_9ACTN|nr:hypothetical protein [Nocardiopsis endophytica]MDA2811595.1 hypothetical protein [Nocardiopsis endophytica]
MHDLVAVAERAIGESKAQLDTDQSRALAAQVTAEIVAEVSAEQSAKALEQGLLRR